MNCHKFVYKNSSQVFCDFSLSLHVSGVGDGFFLALKHRALNALSVLRDLLDVTQCDSVDRTDFTRYVVSYSLFESLLSGKLVRWSIDVAVMLTLIQRFLTLVDHAG